MKDWFILQYRKSFLAELFSKRKRSAGKKSKKSSPKKSKRKIKLSFNTIVFLFVLIPLVLVLLGSVYFWNYYGSIEFRSEFEGQGSGIEVFSEKIRPGSKAHTLIIPYSKQDGYVFIFAPSIMNIDFDNNRFGILTIQPYLEVEPGITIQNYFNTVGTDSEVSSFEGLTATLESALGIQLDAYFAYDVTELNNQSLQKLFQNSLNKESISEQLSFASNNYLRQINSEYEVLFSEANNVFTKYTLLLRLDQYTQRELYTNLNASYLLTVIENLDQITPFNYANNIDQTHGILNSESLPLKMSQNRTLIDEQLQDVFRDIQIVQEQAEVEIFNGTQQVGYALSISRIFENNGINVVKLGNFPELQKENILYIPDGTINDFPATIGAIDKILDGNIVYSQDTYKRNYSGDIILILGE